MPMLFCMDAEVVIFLDFLNTLKVFVKIEVR